MSQQVSRSDRRRQARRLSPGCIVSDNLSNPRKPVFDGRPVGKPSTGFVPVRGKASSEAFDGQRTRGSRAHDPAGNTFTAHYERGSRPDYKRDERLLADAARHSKAFQAALDEHRKRKGWTV